MIAKIVATVGEGRKNNPADVREIQTLLRIVKATPEVDISGEFNDRTKRAIGNFQRDCKLREDRWISPRGTTLRHLNRASVPLELTLISQKRIKAGGYKIECSGFVPPLNYRLWVLLDDGMPTSAKTYENQCAAISSDAVEIKDFRVSKKWTFNDFFSYNHLRKLLDVMSERDYWGRSIKCCLFVTQKNGDIVSKSNVYKLSCPVQPYEGDLDPSLGEPDSGPALKYTGIKDGRMFFQPSIDGRYYYAFKDRFETDNRKRGLNCITYVGAVYGVNPAIHALRSSEKLATCLDATECDMEDKKPSEIKQFFKEDRNRSGTYIMWEKEHVVLIVDGTVHEFAESKGGYNKPPPDIQAWRFRRTRYTLRRISIAFGGCAGKDCRK